MNTSRYRLKNHQSNEEESTEPVKGVDVADILKDNHKREQETEKPLNLEKAKSKKKRDYVLVMILVNVLIALPWLILDRDFLIGVFSLSGIVIFSSGFTWAMWQVLNDY